MYRNGMWPDTPSGIKQKNFRHSIREWVRIEEACGPDALRHKARNKIWTLDEKLNLVLTVMEGNSIKSTALNSGINQGLLSQWVQIYKIKGYTDLANMKKGRPLKESHMKHENNKSANQSSLSESEREELLLLRKQVAYLSAENEVIKKEIALREEKQAARLKAKKQRLSKNSEKKDTN